jgi:hypothetical protein
MDHPKSGQKSRAAGNIAFLDTNLWLVFDTTHTEAQSQATEASRQQSLECVTGEMVAHPNTGCDHAANFEIAARADGLDVSDQGNDTRDGKTVHNLLHGADIRTANDGATQPQANKCQQGVDGVRDCHRIRTAGMMKHGIALNEACTTQGLRIQGEIEPQSVTDMACPLLVVSYRACFTSSGQNLPIGGAASGG